MLTFVSNKGQVDLYIDGVKVDTGTYPYYSTDGLKLMLGGSTAEYSYGVSYQSSLKMDNLRIYGATLTGNQIMEIYNSEK